VGEISRKKSRRNTDSSSFACCGYPHPVSALSFATAALDHLAIREPNHVNGFAIERSAQRIRRLDEEISWPLEAERNSVCSRY